MASDRWCSLAFFFFLRQAATQAIALGVGKRLQESVKQQQSGNRSWWKLREASVLAVGSTAEVLINAPQGFDHHQFMAAILQPDLQTTGNSPAIRRACAQSTQLISTHLVDTRAASPFLRGRALWCASQFSHAVAADKSLPFIQAAVASLQSQQDPLPVKICACRALASYCPKVLLCASSQDLGEAYTLRVLTVLPHTHTHTHSSKIRA